MENIQRLPVDGASDDVLINRLYELALCDDHGSNELRMLDYVVYTRLLHAYGSEEPDLRPRMAA